jgi:UDP-GlcNAc:undecaprenyl-phosphate/decaprenyl-phosphate GlcNAc-1-phosphate transferase
LYESGLYLVIVYVSFFLVALLFSLLINGLFLRFSKTLGIRNHTEKIIRWSSTSKPAFGGISFYMVFLISVAALSFIFKQNDYFHNVRSLGILAATTLAFLMGLFDDSYNTKVWLKLFTQVACAVILIATGTYVQISGYVWLDYSITLVWVVGMMNSINMLDNMDGISTIVSLFIFITSLVLLCIGINTDLSFLVIFIGMIAALSGFLVYNWHPSKMFMGDTGSQFLGALLAITGILFFWNQDGYNYPFPAKRFILTAIMFVLPISDTTAVIIARLRKGKSPFIGGLDHTTHHLSYMGLSDRGVALVFLGFSIINTALVIVASLIRNWNIIHTLLFGLYFLVIFTFMLIVGNKKSA